MPMVQPLIKRAAQIDEVALFLACRQVVPAAYSTKRHPVTPGSINFDPRYISNDAYQNTDVIITTEGFYFHDRAEILDEERTPLLLQALKELFPLVTFAAWPKLVTAGWASDVGDPSFEGDLAMAAAVERAKLDFGRYEEGEDLEEILMAA